jgi:predicted nucleotidyltransferase
MTLPQLESGSTHLLLKCISGSQAYGLALPHSDTDVKGVYVLPKEEYFGLHYTDQVNNETNDVMYYEVGKFFELLLKNNPNLLELLSTPEDCVLYRHSIMKDVNASLFISRLCYQTFGQYAYAQIKKAKGLNKKILNPMDKQRKSVIDFCYIVHGQGSMLATEWLKQKNFKSEECGLIRIDHLRDTYALFHQSQSQRVMNGIYAGESADDVRVSSIEEGLQPSGILYFNKDGYSVYCKEYKQYWEWVSKRNEERYENTVQHGKNYDAKNMMHVFRLLHMAEEIARYKKINVKRKEREWLLRVRAGEFLYDDLLKQAEEKIKEIGELFLHSDLPEQPDEVQLGNLLVKIRDTFYMQHTRK